MIRDLHQSLLEGFVLEQPLLLLLVGVVVLVRFHEEGWLLLGGSEGRT